ncbi:hypothetical protein ABZ434_06245 [Streptomyces sp. NPDC005761]|uniref:hypothetical protein n=1 Tax=unclassified Streptomyces TaxID=2593676 RepID=UPI0033E9A72E
MPHAGEPEAVELSRLRAASAEADHIHGNVDMYVREGLKPDAATVESPRAGLLSGAPGQQPG